MGRARLLSGWQQGFGGGLWRGGLCFHQLRNDLGAERRPRGQLVFGRLFADGMKPVAVIFGGGIYASTNSGATWELTSAPASNWASVASSADGLTRVAAVYGGPILCLSHPTGIEPHHRRHQCDSFLADERGGYALQQDTNVETTNWTPVTNTPTVTNSQYNVTMPLSGVRHFYRLRRQ